MRPQELEEQIDKYIKDGGAVGDVLSMVAEAVKTYADDLSNNKEQHEAYIWRKEAYKIDKLANEIDI